MRLLAELTPHGCARRDDAPGAQALSGNAFLAEPKAPQRHPHGGALKCKLESIQAR